MKARKRVRHSSIYKSSEHDFQKLKEDALDLLESSIEDVSPDPSHPIRMKMGIEREGHFICPQMRPLKPDEKPYDWEDEIAKPHYKLIEKLEAAFSEHPEFMLERIYHDTSGSYQLEMTTKPVTPKQAAKATNAICTKMTEVARSEGYTRICFGSMPIDFLEPNDVLTRAFLKKSKQLVDTPSGEILVGRGQHANVSIWCGDKNLFHISPFTEDFEKVESLGDAVVNQALQTLPGMVLPSRNGNYHRIAYRAPLEVQSISASAGKKEDNAAVNWSKTIYKQDDVQLGNNNVHDVTRLEYRQAAPDADPLDVALAAAIPTTKAFLESVKLDKNGKVIIIDDIPQFDFHDIKVSAESDMPKSHNEAAFLFNQKDNPNFTYLDELAEKRIAKLEQAKTESATQAIQIALRKAKNLRGIGSRLHSMYCEYYNLIDRMQTTPSVATIGA
jgi:hypothetical protein